MFICRVLNKKTGALITQATGESLKVLSDWADKCEAEDSSCVAIVEPALEEQAYKLRKWGKVWDSQKLKYVNA